MHDFDCAVVGSGIAGSMLAMALARNDLRVLVVEQTSHPRFAIGESTVPTTTQGLERIARRYDIPEIRLVSHYLGLREHGLPGWPKLGFWFGGNRPGEAMRDGEQLMFVSPSLPLGPDVHMLRSAADAFLVERLPRYGVEYRDRTSIGAADVRPDGVTLHTSGGRVRARFVIDCSGHASFFARTLGLRDAVPRLRTNSRSIFTHVRGVRSLDELAPVSAPGLMLRRDLCTIHHFFRGGWLWAIRFDNDTASIGLQLDREVFPDNGEDAAREFDAIVEQFPTVRAHLEGAEPIRPFTKTGRVQFTSRSMAAGPVLLSPHAASFVDPLFSTGIDLTATFIGRVVPLIRRAVRETDDSAFATLDRLYEEEIATVDTLVHGMYRSFVDFDVAKQFWRAWIYTTLLGYFTQRTCDVSSVEEPQLGHFGSSVAAWRRQLDAMHAIAVRGGDDPRAAAFALKASMDAMDEPFDRESSNWRIGSDTPGVPCQTAPPVEWFRRRLQADPVLSARFRREVFDEWSAVDAERGAELDARYAASLARGDGFHHDVDFIREQRFFAYRAGR